RHRELQALAALRAALSPDRENVAPGIGAGEFSWWDVPGFRLQHLPAVEAAIDAEAGSLAAKLVTSAEWTKHDRAPTDLQPWVDERIDRVAARYQTAPRRAEEIGRLLDCGLQAVTPLCCGEGGDVRTLAYVPQTVYEALGHRDELCVGRDGELLIVALQ